MNVLLSRRTVILVAVVSALVIFLAIAMASVKALGFTLVGVGGAGVLVAAIGWIVLVADCDPPWHWPIIGAYSLAVTAVGVLIVSAVYLFAKKVGAA